MDKVDELLDKYRLVPDIEHVNEIRRLLEQEILNQHSEDHEYLKALCIQLFALGNVADTRLIWKAKRKDFDAGCYIDVQLLCGAGVGETIDYLRRLDDVVAKQESDFIEKSIEALDFEGFNREDIIENYRAYYGID